ncbi:MAG TPA: protein-disulfide reductase DsbD [Rhodanobacteraceae bacterium]|nr:protein-disulfide reductase DsbD [Rhodanobacteraceae bacterium]
MSLIRRGLAALLLLILPGLVAHVHAQEADGLLPVTQAFRLSARVEPGVVHLHWTIADGYYLYRQRIHVVAKTPGITLGALALPAGIVHPDPYQGPSVIYRHRLDASLPYRGDGSTLILAVSMQGCHEIDPKICYPPHTDVLTLALTDGAPSAATTAGDAVRAAFAPPPPAATANAFADRGGASVAAASTAAAAATPAATGAAGTAEQHLAGLLGSSRLLALALFFLGGLAIAFTPCVLPMIPILSGLIAGGGTRATPRRAFALSLAYVLGASVVYAAVGVVAGLVGTNLQTWLQQPLVVWAMALLFVALALSMFGFYELQLPARWQTRLAGASDRQRAGSLAGAAVMGLLSALIVTSCVTPVLVAGVLYISQSGSPLFGALALFLFGLGMGVPLIAFGVAAGALLPRAGAWMNTVKAVFGVVFLGLAIWMLDRVLDVRWIMLLAGALLVAAAVYLGALERLPEGASGWRRLWKALGVLLLLAGAAEIIGAAAGGNALLTPLAGLTAGRGGSAVPAAALAMRPVKTVADVERAVAAAAAEGRPAMLDVYADWCVSCKVMEAGTLADPRVRQALSGFVLLRADVTANDAADRALLAHYGLVGPPGFLFFGRDGHEDRARRLIGEEGADGFLARVQAVMAHGS